MINLIQNPSTSKPTENYSLMMMGSEYMVDGDDIGDDDGEDSVESPCLAWRAGPIYLASTTKIVMLAALCFVKISLLGE
jgi:hypothetical protein